MVAASYRNGKLIGQSIDAVEFEEHLIGSLLGDAKQFDAIQELQLDGESFFDVELGTFFQTLKGFRDEGIPTNDHALLGDTAKKIFKDDGVARLMVLMTRVPHAFHARYYGERVKDAADRRRAKAFAMELIQRSSDPSQPLRPFIETWVSEFEQRQTRSHQKRRASELNFEDPPAKAVALIDGFLRVGETANLIAASKAGKSWLSLDLALCVATGRPWLNTFQTIESNVLYVDNELKPVDFENRLISVAQARRTPQSALDRFYYECIRGQCADIFRLEEYLKPYQSDDIKLVILDAFYRFLPHGTSENDNAQMMELYNHLDRMAARFEFAFLLIHHASKGDQSGKQVTDVGSGAGSISRAADSHIVIRPHETEGLSVLEKKVRSFPPTPAISMRWDWPLWHATGDEPKLKTQKTVNQEQRTQQDQEAIDDIVARLKGGRLTRYEIRRELGAGQQRADRLIAQGVKRGLIRKCKEKRGNKKIEVFDVCSDV